MPASRSIPQPPRRRPRHRRRRRRGLVATLIAVPLVAALAGGGIWIGTQVGPRDTVRRRHGRLRRPRCDPPARAVAPSTPTARASSSLDAQAGHHRVRARRADATWGFNGSYLGPTLVADRGERVRVDVTNSLDEPTTVHWHGMHLPAAMDGGPHQMVEPGATWSPEWTIDQPAATLWYHPHPHGETRSAGATRASPGMFLVRGRRRGGARPAPRLRRRRHARHRAGRRLLGRRRARRRPRERSTACSATSCS